MGGIYLNGAWQLSASAPGWAVPGKPKPRAGSRPRAAAAASDLVATRLTRPHRRPSLDAPHDGDGGRCRVGVGKGVFHQMFSGGRVRAAAGLARACPSGRHSLPQPHDGAHAFCSSTLAPRRPRPSHSKGGGAVEIHHTGLRKLPPSDCHE